MLFSARPLKRLRSSMTTLNMAAALIVSFSALPAAQAGELEKIKAAGRITIAHRDTSIPFSYLDANKKPIGYAMDLCSKLVDAIRAQLQIPALPVDYLAVSSAARIPTIVESKASLECGSTTNTAERRKQVDFTISHFIASVRLLTPVSSNITAVDDLSGKTVVSTKGSTSITELARINTERLLKIKIMPANNHQEGFDAVAAGTAQAFAMDDVLLSGLRAQSKEPAKYAIVGKPMTVEPYAIMLPKDDEAFKKVVNQEMLRLIRSGELQALYAKWFQKPIAPNGINLEMPMSYLLRESLRYPTDKVSN
ncbi:amino acid ABC transporter substrate-binding protein [Comamonas sp. Y33R10-2]|uniref:amino acid ABC transporter substrate-binding protein n=1 Tax=Comamonas sp. Y33R10-2 TaxID=2853257 RepID=UPI002104DC66|nr:amino acid ABC transporter substrate-binding protein [Comamonas sp. Y33R10-2]